MAGIREYAEQFAIDFVDFISCEKSMYAIMYGDQSDRFADGEREYTIAELLEIYKQYLIKQP